jgi:hypothetical protein
VEVGVSFTVTARRIIRPVLFNKTINYETCVEVILRQFFLDVTEEERLSYCPHCIYLYASLI